MKLDVFDVVVLTIHANHDEIVNNTSIQKLIYFHTRLIKNLDISYPVHNFFGPSSPNVTEALGSLSDFSYVDRSVVSSYFEVFNYKLTDTGIEYAKTIVEKYPCESKKIFEIVEICQKCCELKPISLSFAAKIYHILENSKDQHGLEYSLKDVKTIVKDLDWTTSKKDTADGIALLEKLHLISSL